MGMGDPKVVMILSESSSVQDSAEKEDISLVAYESKRAERT